MKPLNNKERNDLILKFGIVFLITVLITAFALFWDRELPAELNQAQREKLNAYNNFERSQKKIIKLMDSLTTQIENMGSTNTPWTISQTRIANQTDFKSLDTSKLSKKVEELFVKFLTAKAASLDYKDKYNDCKGNAAESDKLNDKILKATEAELKAKNANSSSQ
jgi:hypothetical protein